ncbi:MAG: Arm DNA-binding domain-containing protein, partial [Gemmatimonadota bacterium]|nr:Arm DNA-binding domain-containing protein [Gemmatimonadota bacterium]
MAGGTQAINRLTDRQIKAFIAKARGGTAPTKKLSDGAGLFLILNPWGSPVWRIKYRFNGKERLAGPGIYPEVGLAEARAARDALRTHLRYGRDPSIE